MDTQLLVVDIDGTVSDPSHRLHLVEGSNPDWQAFVSPDQVAKDTVVPGCVSALRFFEARRWEIVFLTGRNEGLREVTRKWLDKNLFFLYRAHPILMRPTGNEQNATEYKRRALMQLYIDYRPGTLMAIDDDPYMWPVYHEFNAVVLQAPGCWRSLFPKQPTDLPPEVPWRK